MLMCNKSAEENNIFNSVAQMRETGLAQWHQEYGGQESVDGCSMHGNWKIENILLQDATKMNWRTNLKCNQWLRFHNKIVYKVCDNNSHMLKDVG